ncbi:Uncharacterised protein [Mycobacterium tuberculosis]|nr:Uncharacterised protein [Mycobacterium tuberculosis]
MILVSGRATPGLSATSIGSLHDVIAPVKIFANASLSTTKVATPGRL